MDRKRLSAPVPLPRGRGVRDAPRSFWQRRHRARPAGRGRANRRIPLVSGVAPPEAGGEVSGGCCTSSSPAPRRAEPLGSALGARRSGRRRGNGARLSALGSRRSALGSRRSALGSRRSALGARLSALGSRLSALGSRLSALGSRLSALGSRLSALGSRLSALGSRLSALGSRLSALNIEPSPFTGGPSFPPLSRTLAPHPARRPAGSQTRTRRGVCRSQPDGPIRSFGQAPFQSLHIPCPGSRDMRDSGTRTGRPDGRVLRPPETLGAPHRACGPARTVFAQTVLA